MLTMKLLSCGCYFEDVSQDCGVCHHINVRWGKEMSMWAGTHMAVGLVCPCCVAEGAAGLVGSSVQGHRPLYLSEGAVGGSALKAGRGFGCLLPSD